MLHIASIEIGCGGPVSQSFAKAECVCGWVGPTRVDYVKAERDVIEHELSNDANAR